MSRLKPDLFTSALVLCVALATILPATGEAARQLGLVSKVAIALLFFLHGARLSRSTAIAGVMHWRLHLVILLGTFVLFPLLGLAIGPVAPWLLTPALYTGVLYLCALPSTVQSAIAFTSIARGNIPAAICSASASNILGIVLTPLLVGLMLSRSGHGGFQLGAIESIVLQLLLPFILGQFCRPLLAGWIGRHKRITGVVDRGSILLVVYIAFSNAVAGGLWHQLSLQSIAFVILIAAALLAVAVAVMIGASRMLGFAKVDEIVSVFCGSNKSLVSGLPMASIIFAGQDIGAILLPLMLYHQIQLIFCAMLARHYAGRTESPPLPAAAA